MWRQDKPGWVLDNELLARLIETVDLWGRIQTDLAAGKRVGVPGPVRIEHPDRPRPVEMQKPKVTTDPAVIQAWFNKHVGR